MIEQRINLYQERFREKRLWLSAQQSALVLAGVVVAIAAASFVLQGDFERLQRDRLALEAERGRLGAELDAANAELTRLLQDSQLDFEIENAARQISARRKVLDFVGANRFGSGEGFSAYLLALSRLHADDIWLSQIRLAQDNLRIRGSSLKAEEVPLYFDRFSDEPVFRGNRFELFELSRDARADWKVDFEIATRGGGDE